MATLNKKESQSRMITVDTKPFGEVEIVSEEVISFPDGIFAFEGYKEYALLSTKRDLSFRWLQSLQEKNISFLVTNPVGFLPDYLPKIPKGDFDLIDLTEDQETNLFCIVTIPAGHPERITMNLQGPIIINFSKMLAAQFVSEDPSHQVREPLFALINDKKKVV